MRLTLAPRGRGTSKTPVMALVQRGGAVRAFALPSVNAKTLKGAIREHVHPDSMIVTDEMASYRGIGKGFRGGHRRVKHSAGEYVRGKVHTNTVESFFALLKRGMYGTFHSVSKRHLHRYIAEFEFRYNTRGLDDGARVVRAIEKAEGKRLFYRQPS